tara:strand:- start:7046 stop:7753 length:708 start_codon:yes stop_codon:yes gene_type:complete
MSIKSLLQLILLLLIFLVIGGIYFLYFYSGPLKNENIVNNSLNKITNKGIKQGELLDHDVLQEVNTNKNKKLIQDKNNKIVNKELNKKKNSSEKIENLTKEIEYVTSNKEGDIFKIFAKYGKTNIENSNILDLDTVNGVITSIKRSKIDIKSDYAKYNYENQNSEFYGNVEIKYDNKIITCDNLDLQIDNDYAIAYNNVKIKDNKSTMKAQIVTLNLITKDININSKDKVKILTD